MTDHSTNPGSAARPAVVVTGASGGIGREIAKVAAAEGTVVVLVARSGEALAETAGEVRRRGGEPFVLALDLTRPEAGDALEEFLAAQNLFCDVLVNNAGFGLHGAAAALAREAQLSLLALNVRTLSDLTLRFLPGMIGRGRGGVINLGSVAGFGPGPYMALYYASKAFVNSFSQALWEETRKSGVTVTCVAPGPVKTQFFSRAGADASWLFSLLPRADASVVAARAWRGFKRGRRMVIPGVMFRLSAFTMAYLPRGLTVPVIGRLQRLRGGAAA